MSVSSDGPIPGNISKSILAQIVSVGFESLQACAKAPSGSAVIQTVLPLSNIWEMAWFGNYSMG